MVGESLFDGIGQANMRTLPSQDLQREALYNKNGEFLLWREGQKYHHTFYKPSIWWMQ